MFLAGLGLLISYRRRLQVAVDSYSKVFFLEISVNSNSHYFSAEEEKESQSFGKALIGGPFQLTDTRGNIFTEKDLIGKFSLV